MAGLSVAGCEQVRLRLCTCRQVKTHTMSDTNTTAYPAQSTGKQPFSTIVERRGFQDGVVEPRCFFMAPLQLNSQGLCSLYSDSLKIVPCMFSHVCNHVAVTCQGTTGHNAMYQQCERNTLLVTTTAFKRYVAVSRIV